MKIEASLGWMGPDPIDIVITNRAAVTVARGDTLMLDVRRNDAASTSNTPGLATAGLANGVVPDTAGAAVTNANAACGIYGVALAAAADDVRLPLRLRGQCDVVNVAGTVVLATDEAYGPADGVKVQTKITAEAAPQTNASKTMKVTFIPLTARTGAGATDGWFDGISGFGCIIVPAAT